MERSPSRRGQFLIREAIVETYEGPWSKYAANGKFFEVVKRVDELKIYIHDYLNYYADAGVREMNDGNIKSVEKLCDAVEEFCGGEDGY
jgi:predicted RNA-binding protein associated with RNAse of E/G family